MLHERTIAALRRTRDARHARDRRHRADGAVAAARARPDRARRSGRSATRAPSSRTTSGDWLRHEPIPLELAREAIAAVGEEGYSPNVYVDDELYVAAETQAARNYASFQHIDIHVVGDLLEWLERAADEARLRRRPGRRSTRSRCG